MVSTWYGRCRIIISYWRYAGQERLHHLAIGAWPADGVGRISFGTVLAMPMLSSSTSRQGHQEALGRLCTYCTVLRVPTSRSVRCRTTQCVAPYLVDAVHIQQGVQLGVQLVEERHHNARTNLGQAHMQQWLLQPVHRFLREPKGDTAWGKQARWVGYKVPSGASIDV